jgi:hypothetical protein
MSSTTIGTPKRRRRASHAKLSYRERETPIQIALNWKVWASLLAFGALWRITVGIGLNSIVLFVVTGGVLIAFGAIRVRSAMRADDATLDAVLAGEPLDETHLAKLRYLEAIERVLNRDASDQDWALIKEHHERTPVA